MPLTIKFGCKLFNNVASNLNELVIQEVEGELDTVGDNMKILEISGGKALEREEKLVDKILSLQAKYKTAEARYGKLQKSFFC